MQFLKRYFHSTRTQFIKVNDLAPEGLVFGKSVSEPVKLNEYLSKKVAFVVTVPGAFTPGCNSQIPSFIKDYKQWGVRGIEEIICLSVNDPFVMQAWKEKLEGDEKLTFFSDPRGEYAKALSLDFDCSEILGGRRFKRSVLLFEYGKLTWMSVEPTNTGLTCTTSYQVYKLLKYLLENKKPSKTSPFHNQLELSYQKEWGNFPLKITE